MQQEILSIIQSLKFQNKVCHLINDKIMPLQGNICLFHLLGQKIDCIWDSSKGNMVLQSSKQINTSYLKQKKFEILKGVQFRHAHKCPYVDSNIAKSEKFYKPCACVLLVRDKDNHILVTRRKLSLYSFPGAWVLPGGHLQKDEGLLEGGLRQAEEEVRLDRNNTEIHLQNGVMAWESAFCANDKIASSSFVIFFSAKVGQYEVKAQQSQIEQFKWKNVKYSSDESKYTTENRDGYGQAHLNYLSFYRNKNYQIQQKKPWIQQLDKQKLDSSQNAENIII